ncbi:hypothetical protein G6N82_12610 [Altererythrobacter sp. BO-6]|uniref:hypothetical protein n=1 Tax=Altererythrobacter sp. BO-6 TaxID=2604537 RepID=UPI0013E14C00|nr:hypothetical protein [Altererythrobacter sp. BO-6]QIG54882.1 hypothetical protein G6N82_12610 [Altererythrobacter sp. BO-6]
MIARWLAAIGLTLSALPLQAQAPDPDWRGVFKGTIGRHQVVACLDRENYGNAGRGTYYYMRHLKLIALKAGDPPGNWREQADARDWDNQNAPIWSLTKVDAAGLSGTWSDQGKALPIRLERVELQDPEGWTLCDDPAFLGPRVKPAEFDSVPGRVGSFDYMRLDYRTPEHFADSVAISGFTFEPREPGDKAILATFAERLPKGVVEDDYIQCVAGAAVVSGFDGDYQEELTPHFANSAFLDVQVTMGDYCGGAYPNFGIWHRVFDRATGEEVDLTTWFTADAFTVTDWGSPQASENLRAIAVAQWPKDEDPECVETALYEPGWRLGLSAEGLLASPALPHVAAACEIWTTIPWDQVEPFLSDKGREERARLR